MLRKILIFVFIVGTIVKVHAKITTGESTVSFISQYDETTQSYQLFIPETNSESIALPLVVVLHGHGADQFAWFNYTPVQKYAELYRYVVASPYARGNNWYRGPAEQDVLDIINDVREKCNIDPNRIYLAGHSMGGWGAWWIGLRHPDLFASICPMSGFAPMDLLPNARNLSPMIVHDSDDPAVNVENSRIPAEKLAKSGISFQYIETQGYGHSSKLIGDYLPRMFEWFNQHHRIQKPTQIEFVTRSPEIGKAYCIQILQTLNFPEPANIVVKQDMSKNLIIETHNIQEWALDVKKYHELNFSNTTCILDGNELPLTGEQWIIFSKDKSGDWQSANTNSEPVVTYHSPVLAKIDSDWLNDLSPEKLSDAVFGLLVKETRNDIALFPENSFQTPRNPLTADQLLELYLFPHGQLIRFRVKGKDLQKSFGTNAISLKIYPTDTKINPNKTYRVLASIRNINLFPTQPDILSKTIDEYLLQIVSKKKSFP